MYQIIASVGNTTWKTKLMTKSGEDFFVVIRTAIRNKEEIVIGDRVNISFKLA